MKTGKQILVYILFASFFLFANVSYSQLKNFGIKGGLNLSNAELDYSNAITNEFNKNKTGFNIYLFYDFLNYKNVIISGEAGYSQKGYNNEILTTDEFGNPSSSYFVYNRANYVDINAIAEFILRGKSVSPYFSFGPVLSIYTGYNISTSGTPYDSSLIAFFSPLFEDLKSPVLGFITGAGIEINKVIPQTIIAEVRYNFDLTNSFNNGFLNYQRNYVWQFNFGLKF